MNSRLTLIAPRALVLAGALISAAACSDDATAPQSARLPSGISAVDNPDLYKGIDVTPVMDGKMTKGEWSDAVSFTYTVQLQSGNNITIIPVTSYVKHDDTYLYLATTFDRHGAFHPNDVIMFDFDNDNDGVREDGDDVITNLKYSAPNVQNGLADQYWTNGATEIKWDTDSPTGGVTDGASAWGTAGTKGVFEFRHTLNSYDDAHDFSINPFIFPQTVGIQASVKLELGAVGSRVYSQGSKPAYNSYCKLTISKTNNSTFMNCS